MEKICKECPKRFKVKRKEQLFCGGICYHLWKAGPNNSNWRGGRYLSKWGYWYVRAPQDHPRKTANGYIFEHRYIVEKSLGRYLKKNEFVHHINGDKIDNRLDNLVILTKKEHNEIHLNSPYKTCRVPQCTGLHAAKGFCDKHHQQLLDDRLPMELKKYIINVRGVC